jgi:hypothetical protein
MLKYQVETRTFYLENPLTAGHPVNGTSVSMLAVENDGPYLIGDSPVKWDEANQKNVNAIDVFTHYENRSYSEDEATTVFEGKIAKLIADGFVFEVHRDMHAFMTTGQWAFEVIDHSASK